MWIACGKCFIADQANGAYLEGINGF